MIVSLTEGAPARLLEPDDFRAFKVVTAIAAGEALRLAAAEVGRLDEGGDHLWVSRTWLMIAGEAAGGADWRKGAEAMLAYADGKGWTDPETGAVRAHIKRR